MTPRRRRIVLVVGILAGVSIAGALALRAFQENVMFFFDPTQVAAGEAPTGERFRLGGMVRPGTVERRCGSLDMNFVVTDFKRDVPVRYSGVVPDLFLYLANRSTPGIFDPAKLRNVEAVLPALEAAVLMSDRVGKSDTPG